MTVTEVARAHRSQLEAVFVALTFVVLLGVTSAVTRRFHAHERALASTFAATGERALATGHADEAVEAYRNALFYSHHDVRQQFRLAQALLAAGRPQDARPYLLTMWRHEPSHGLVNLELARIEAADGRTEEALRHYEGAVHGTWDDTLADLRQAVRRELVQFLVKSGAGARAVAATIDWESTLTDGDALGHTEAGELLARLGQPRLALASFRTALRVEPRSPRALVGAARAASETGDWRLTRSYVRQVPIAERDEAARELLVLAENVLALDPWATRLSLTERGRRARLAIALTRERLDTCTDADAVADLRRELDALAPALEDRVLRRDPEQLDPAFATVLGVAQRATCGPPRPVDAALLAIARDRRDGDG